MDWYYALNDEQQGPVSDIQLEELIRAGTITPATLVWHKKLSGWHPLSVVRSAAVASGTLPPLLPLPTTRCVECGNIFEHKEMLSLNTHPVCVPCKSKFLVRMRDGGKVPGSTGMLWRDKNTVVLRRKDTLFPDRCIRCNADAEGFKLKREVWWHPPVYYALAICPVIYVVVVYLIRTKAVLHVGLCESHRAERKRTIFIATIASVSGLVLLLLAAFIENGWLALAGLFLLVGAGIYGALKAAVVTATKIDNEFIFFKGAGKPFLKALQPWTRPK